MKPIDSVHQWSAFTARACLAVGVLCLGCNNTSVESPPSDSIEEAVSEDSSKTETSTWNPFRRDENEDSKPVDAGLRFTEVAEASGVDFVAYGSPSPEHYMTEQNGSGVALLDFDADGWLDLFLPNGDHPDRPAEQTNSRHKLYRSREAWNYRDVAINAGVAQTGYGMGCATSDFDSDGFVDLFLAGYDQNRLWRNNGDGSFSEVILPRALFTHRWSASAAFADLNADGFPDLYVTNYVNYSFEDGACFTQHQPRPVMIPCGPLGRVGQPDTLLENRGNGTFGDISEEAGISKFQGKGLGVSIADFNGDRQLDIYVANDTTENLLFENQGGFRFSETGLLNGVALGADGRARSGMGVACGDCNSDGDFDLVVTNFQHEPYDLFIGSKDSGFVARNREMGLDSVTRPMLGFGVCFGDFDLDTDLDLFIANGHVWDLSPLNLDYQFAMQSQIFLNDQGQQFLDVSSTSGKWFKESRVGRAVAVGDLDNDGDEDQVVTSLNSNVALLRNDSKRASSSVTVRLIGVTSARDSRGVRVDIKLGSKWLIRRIPSGDSFQASSSSEVLFATLEHDRIDTIRVHWPGRDAEEWHDQPATGRLILIEGEPALSTGRTER